MKDPKIIYTLTDEAPALATYSLLPIIRKFAQSAEVDFELADISLAGRILASFPEHLQPEQRIPDDLARLGQLVQEPEANVIKLPNISASIPQLKAAIKELQDKGYALPNYPESPHSDEDRKVKKIYDKIKGSAVNPVLREGNSDRRAPKAVKQYAKNHPHRMGAWSSQSKSHVYTMTKGDFFDTEQSITIDKEDSFTIEFVTEKGDTQILKESAPLLKGEILDAAVLKQSDLRQTIKAAMSEALEEDILFSVHLKATMMKVSDPVLFGQVVALYFESLFTKHKDEFAKLSVDPNLGMTDILNKIKELPKDVQDQVLADLDKCYKEQPDLAMVNSDKGITNLHVPSDVIIDASMPAAIRNSGQMWGPDGNSKDTLYLIPDRSYAGIYQKTIENCKKEGAFDPTTMGSVANIGLMAQQAEEYGSHDKTFIAPSKGVMQAINSEGKVLLSQEVEQGDIFRMCQVKDAPIQDWIGLAVKRAKATQDPAIFWLNPKRAHDNQIINKINTYLPQYETTGLDIQILSPEEATEYTLQRIRKGLNTISVTGNVLRDYLTDLFPILEVGTSAKMLSIVPLMEGGGLFETGAGGSAPKHVQQFQEENHLRWDSLGEFLAIAVSLEHLSQSYGNTKAGILGETLEEATANLLEANKSPSRKAGQIDNRGSHFFLCLYWAKALSEQTKDAVLKEQFTPFYKALADKESTIEKELINCQNTAVDMKGYYKPDVKRVSQLMRPSATFNTILDSNL
ncbi:NADP-dependent isocitrate dehydrogenase [Spirochaeta cellobiosiphila]|uniref:NADP-dependent isocitrate dehydrogenase n=1 Tax=Spirochaeta cellobiosiphila TaxID=504483 RepID=UPI0003F8F377|nr:NADP-dependent isocitrate dehydrogenase [Spirochaeta cellobiosiphila]